MSRPIEFRAWNEVKGYWSYFTLEDIAQGYVFNEDRSESTNIRAFGLEYLTHESQFTGLIDKNGTKIFEGDILKHEGVRHDGTSYILNYPVEWSMSVGYDEPGIGYNLSPDEVSKDEVVGSIYENPDLLEK